jgi:hypothetical protein
MWTFEGQDRKGIRASIALRQSDGCRCISGFCALWRCMKGSMVQNRKLLNFLCA